MIYLVSGPLGKLIFKDKVAELSFRLPPARNFFYRSLRRSSLSCGAAAASLPSIKEAYWEKPDG
jgi:hypothetical protein